MRSAPLGGDRTGRADRATAHLVSGLAPEQQNQPAGLLRVLLRDVQQRLDDRRLAQVGEPD
ncbi:hypothetical protein [Streptomyces tubbatahanensis]|uniref:hypothetical protein n=1 Tax=Streptomyces tubbatahanensis TaxID=2923272 RepID=UPI00311B3A8C